MPFPLLAHQAPVLPFKMLRPARFSGTALVAGSLAPDLADLILLTHPKRVPVLHRSHSLLGLVVFCLPASLAIVWSFSRWVAEPLSRHLPHGAPFHLEDVRLAALRTVTVRDWARVLACALLGSLTHVGIDSFTHGSGWAIRWWPWLGRTFHVGRVITTPSRALQYILTALLGVVALVLIARILRSRALRTWAGAAADTARPLGTRRSVRYWTVVAVITVTGFVLALPVVPNAWMYFEHPRYYGWMAVLFLTACSFYVGLCASGAVVDWGGAKGSKAPRA